MNISLNEAECALYEVYYKFLEEKNKVMNLTAISGIEDVYTLHFLDCIALTKFYSFFGKRVIDIGSGAGFPGMPLRLCTQNMSLTVLDAQQKRILFLRELSQRLSLQDVVCLHARAEEAAGKADMREQFDCAVSRAVARLPVLCELCMPFVRIGGKFIAMKSVDTQAEINDAENAIALLGGKIESVSDYTVPCTNVVHRAIIIEKTAKTPSEFPRRFAKIQKTPL